jgi:hypothetical protein
VRALRIPLCQLRSARSDSVINVPASGSAIAEAEVIFQNRFKRNPNRVTCTCCGDPAAATCPYYGALSQPQPDQGGKDG